MSVDEVIAYLQKLPADQRKLELVCPSTVDPELYVPAGPWPADTIPLKGGAKARAIAIGFDFGSARAAAGWAAQRKSVVRRHQTVIPQGHRRGAARGGRRVRREVALELAQSARAPVDTSCAGGTSPPAC